MISETMCVLFAESYSAVSNELAADRTLATVPFAGRYRLIDFVLSSLVKAGVNNVGILTKEHYGSLVDHLGAGKDWDLDRKNGGLKILTPFSRANFATTRNRSKVDALISCATFLKDAKEDYVILADSNIVMNIDFKDVIRQHTENKADITVVYQKRSEDNYTGLVVDEDRDGRIIDAYYTTGQANDVQNEVLKVFVFNKDVLTSLLDRAYTFGWVDFERDFITKNITKLRICGYEHKGYCAVVNTVADVYKANIDMLTPAIRKEIFESDTTILTRVKNSAPTLYGFEGKVRNSLVADGCAIEGTVEDCVIFRGVKIGKGAVLKGCVIGQDSVIEPGAKLECVVTDKDVVITADTALSGHPTYPYVIAKGKTV